MSRFNIENYVDVQERINRLWSEYPDGAIRTKLMSLPDDFTSCRYMAEIYKNANDPHPAATGYAYERATPPGSTGSNVNMTSHEENCETSAIGRALANMGYAKNREERPSRQEMQKVERMTETTSRPAFRSIVGGPQRPDGVSPASWKYLTDLMNRHVKTMAMIEDEIRISGGDVVFDSRRVNSLIDWLKQAPQRPYFEWLGVSPVMEEGPADDLGARYDDMTLKIANATLDTEFDLLWSECEDLGLTVSEEFSQLINNAFATRMDALSAARKA